jgi:hypothetical protein
MAAGSREDGTSRWIQNDPGAGLRSSALGTSQANSHRPTPLRHQATAWKDARVLTATQLAGLSETILRYRAGQTA